MKIGSILNNIIARDIFGIKDIILIKINITNECF